MCWCANIIITHILAYTPQETIRMTNIACLVMIIGMRISLYLDSWQLLTNHPSAHVAVFLFLWSWLLKILVCVFVLMFVCVDRVCQLKELGCGNNVSDTCFICRIKMFWAQTSLFRSSLHCWCSTMPPTQSRYHSHLLPARNILLVQQLAKEYLTLILQILHYRTIH